MAGIAGMVSMFPAGASDRCSLMLDSMAQLGPNGRAIGEIAGACFGKLFYHTLPEDDFDRQPYIGMDGNCLLVADVRIDNRDELALGLGIPPDKISDCSDAELLLAGWSKWRLAVTDRILGDAAFAVWEKAEQKLTLVRTPLSSRPLFFQVAKESAAFASLPAALLALPEVRRQPNIPEFAKFMSGGLYLPGFDSLFEGMRILPQGHAVVIRKGQSQSRKLWSLDGQVRHCIGDAGELLRNELDRATNAQLRRRGGPVSVTLSAGRDSSAVATSIASGEGSKGHSIVAITAAPREGFVGNPRELSDESKLAALTASRTGLDHHICRSRTTELSRLLDDVSRVHFQPFGNPVNLPWLEQVARAAAVQSSILLNGNTGNFTVSLGGPGFLADYWRERGLLPWSRLAFKSRCDLQWRRIMSFSFGSLVPARLYSAVYGAFIGRPAGWNQLALLRGSFRQMAEDERRQQLGDVRAHPSRRMHYASVLQAIEPGDRYSLALWGVDVRDPTADRRLAELCYSLPVEAYFGAGNARPAYNATFADRLPRQIIENDVRGYQSADWFQTIDADDIRASMARYGKHPLVDELFDLPAIEERISAWPKADGANGYDLFCNQLLGVLSVASFINAQFPI